ncbi:hypothetical protein K1719_031412 [Acacia pycnantha]|nr:hypothetical protein K1719_031412 [Acacia pycnantha]
METLVLQIKNNRSGSSVKSKFFEQALNRNLEEKGDGKVFVHYIKLPSPPPSPLSPVSVSLTIPPRS